MSTDVHGTADREWIGGLQVMLTEDFERLTARLTELTADSGDSADAYNRDALVAATRQNLDNITGALRRIADGTYGTCEKCDGVIPRERLEVVPHARFCVPCQQKLSGY
ncbi:TraR/DksA family transcriptional regulator [Planosporangium thailandense]|uniref:TraR/DksA family transcriptional regulator n=1 Tax=Planosporangium thailandense TaxID=765197 RepID=A0ABX0XZ87_9ACTN|nr:TraR/DksA C4-type zinc finger protein [Planosporangium thailandense]NJC71368.1 TraR/DksA family transcriptional regulator [Planosporangium thailandense]